MRGTRRKATLIFIILLFLLPSILIERSSHQISPSSKTSRKQKREVETPVQVSEPSSYTATPVADGNFVINKLETAFEAYNLFLLGTWHTDTGVIDYSVVLLDMDGNVIREKYIGNNFTTTSVDAEFINSTTVLLGGPNEAALWNYYDDSLTYLNISGHHEYEYNPVADTFFTLNYYRIDIGGILYQFDYIEEYTSAGELVWSMDTRDFISPTQWCPYHEMWADARDITHSNTVFYDSDEDTIYYNSRNTNTFYKIDHNTSSVIWGVGEYGDFTLYDINGIQKDELFYHAHSVEPIGNDTFILFDNDYHNQVQSNSRVSKITEITVNTQTMTANISWVWEAPSDYWSIRWGDADRLPNGNRLGTFGTEDHPGSQYSARLVEVDDAGTVVWEMSFLKPSGIDYIVYRMDRVGLSPFLTTPDDAFYATNSSIDLSWSAWYNFRPKREVNGTYILQMNDVVYDSGELAFDSLWRPKELFFNIGTLPDGNYTFTLAVSDGNGHFTNDTMNVYVGDLLISRSGYTEAECGDSGLRLVWSGVTNSPLHCNITINNVLHNDFTWTGSDIVLDLQSISPGIYEIALRLYNDSLLVYVDSFTVTIHPAEAPQFLSFPSNTELEWNSSVRLQWDISDDSNCEIEVLLDAALISKLDIDRGYYLLNWSLPLLDEGSHVLEVRVTDILGQRTTDSVAITIVSPSPPAVEYWPADTAIMWGSSNIRLNWKVHGGLQWKVLKNNTEAYSGVVSGNFIQVAISSWQNEGWRLGSYNVTLVIWDASSVTSVTSWIEVVFAIGDAYADDFVESQSVWLLNGNNAIGPPDGESAIVFLDYGNGLLTLDMGAGEEIIDGENEDFKVVADGGTYRVSVSQVLESSFVDLGTATGNATFDLSDSGFTYVRYVKIEYFAGDSVAIDAIVAFNHNAPKSDAGPPIITGPPDFVMSREQSSILNWSISEDAPWSYRIWIDGFILESGPLSTDRIQYVFETSSIGDWNVTLEVEDVFGNSSSDMVMVRVLPDYSVLAMGFIITLVIPLLVFFGVLFLRTKRVRT
jgi:hypothetical protein